MPMYKRGRPKRAHDISDIPEKCGEYRIVDNNGEIKYIGETNNLNRRMKEHSRNGKIDGTDSVYYQEADGRSTSRTRREHESHKIYLHDPYDNKRGGGGGRLG